MISFAACATWQRCRVHFMRHALTHAGKSGRRVVSAFIATKYWEGLRLFLTDGRIEIDNIEPRSATGSSKRRNVERTIRPIALNRKNALFAGHDAGAENWATIASLVETCKLNGVDPQGFLTRTLTAIINGHKQSRIDELLPWNYPAKV